MKQLSLFLFFAFLLSACSSDDVPVGPLPHINEVDKVALTDIAEKLGLDYDSPEIVKKVQLDPYSKAAYITELTIISDSKRVEEVTLSPMIGKLSRLKSLILSAPFTQNPIIPEIFDCPLEYICIDNSTKPIGSVSTVKAEIPGEISKLENTLKCLEIEDFILDGLPKEIGCLKKLEILNLWRNKMDRLTIPEEFSGLVNLRKFLATRSRIKYIDPIPESFGQLPNLMMFDLSYNELSGEVPSFFSVFRPQCEVWLYWNSYSEMNWDYIREGWNLPVLRANCLTGKVPVDAQPFMTMEHIGKLRAQNPGYGITFPARFKDMLESTERCEE